MTDRPVGFGRESRSGGGSATLAPGVIELDDELVAGLLPERPKRGHKGTFGKVLVVAGSLDYAGAALLVCRGAGRAGAGLVTLAVPESLQPLFAAKVVEATTMALPEDDVEEVEPEEALARILDHEHDAMVLGPGLRPGLATTELVRHILEVPEEPTPAPIVLDAEALRSLATLDNWWEGIHRSAVLTPHSGEFGRLRAGSGIDPGADGDLVADDAARANAARSAAESWHQVVVLKGARTVIAGPDGSVSVAPFENPALATGGTGDVLAGAIGSLLAQGLPGFDAARVGVYLHGLAGEAIRERLGDAGLLASDLPEPLAVARRRLAGIAERRRAGKRLGFGSRSGDGDGRPGSGGDEARA
ncbi:MAG TPA: NAD(P)H-hydrate dehydratase [Candidatus Limnocylindrales bacterium]|jgi:NAD(P)H-hydrate epimerase